MTDLLKGKVRFVWSAVCHSAFEAGKQRFSWHHAWVAILNCRLMPVTWVSRWGADTRG